MCVGLATCHTEEKEVLLVAQLSKAVDIHLRDVNTPTKIPDTLAKHIRIYIRKLMNRYKGQESFFATVANETFAITGHQGQSIGRRPLRRSALLI